MIPVLLVLCYMHRVVSFGIVTQQDLSFDFSSLEQKRLVALQQDQKFDMLTDKDSLTEIVQQVTGKGIIPLDYQLAFFDFVMLWYFMATFVVQGFALLYYRKYRDN